MPRRRQQPSGLTFLEPLSGLTDVLTVAGTATATVFFNRSQRQPGAWRIGEILLGLVVGAGSYGTVNLVAAGVVTGALIDTLTATAR